MPLVQATPVLLVGVSPAAPVGVPLACSSSSVWASGVNSWAAPGAARPARRQTMAIMVAMRDTFSPSVAMLTQVALRNPTVYVPLP